MQVNCAVNASGQIQILWTKQQITQRNHGH